MSVPWLITYYITRSCLHAQSPPRTSAPLSWREVERTRFGGPPNPHQRGLRPLWTLPPGREAFAWFGLRCAAAPLLRRLEATVSLWGFPLWNPQRVSGQPIGVFSRFSGLNPQSAVFCGFWGKLPPSPSYCGRLSNRAGRLGLHGPLRPSHYTGAPGRRSSVAKVA